VMVVDVWDDIVAVLFGVVAEALRMTWEL